jgi:hypothetical protein
MALDELRNIMEKVHYGYTLNRYYSDCSWQILEGRKGYEYDAYVWGSDNKIAKPTKEDLDEKWQTAKRDTHMWKEVIEERNRRLQDSDRYVLSDYPHVTEKVKQQWIEYRQALRDFTKTATPTVDENGKVCVAWPIMPE